MKQEEEVEEGTRREKRGERYREREKERRNIDRGDRER